ncbi:hypothetical protein SERLA73DRAFT_191294 [Serpula lacrymans var. lacrymans S7.3]|uniref:Uncharacterized protein n=2 Tax=Serpula lacrymans var. lacrymans TaxID=341189 RepID=F8QH87_SERL3|nr:uncharacterized protein SERLADRAFT_459915 [Serpula lacrymans var. lacrymans S7.9]EGN92336.1 hypothetical protein SERLA73DRAFT_191294 [Serpula lacrymans var. lacrymans S7.3]EGO27088.1 hypothetical protein SERLADRAFT_459915 [Serpula lacrymans var. lacrymans S7.9]
MLPRFPATPLLPFSHHNGIHDCDVEHGDKPPPHTVRHGVDDLTRDTHPLLPSTLAVSLDVCLPTTFIHHHLAPIVIKQPSYLSKWFPS